MFREEHPHLVFVLAFQCQIQSATRLRRPVYRRRHSFEQSLDHRHIAAAEREIDKITILTGRKLEPRHCREKELRRFRLPADKCVVQCCATGAIERIRVVRPRE